MRAHCVRSIGLITLLFIAIILQACDIEALEEGPEEDPPEDDRDRINITQQEGGNIHDDFAAVSEQISDFGGFFFDELGTPNVYLQNPDSDRTDEVRRVLEEVWGADILSRGDSPRRPVDNPQIELREGRYAMSDLLVWFEQLHNVFEVEDVVFIDLHEQENELTVAVENENALGQVEEVLGQIEIPREAVTLTVTDPLNEHNHTVRSAFDTQRGGTQISNGSGRCTFGFTSFLDGSWGFLTNSHCTNQRGTVSGTTFDQPSGGSQIGVEIIDPDFSDCGFLGQRSCRFSDAAFAAYDDGVEPAFGGSFPLIARPEDWTSPSQDQPGPLDIDHGSPTLSINSTESYPFGGEMLDKIGYRTGWTYGFVFRTCTSGRPVRDGSRIRVNGSIITYRCQDRATYHSNSGDSGSPVFKWKGDTVTLYGINWGSNSRGGVFSAMWNIREDFNVPQQ